jgi:diacylglycerol kinase
LIGKAKDYSAAAVLIAAVISLVVGAIIFVPKLLDLI